ncbi:MAG: 2-C-methyl-D-erythritol 4-phosphate cytidylyltransferase [Candidatus Melainabacteria bacterium GWF2_32_7]|nr:MAG: 2-C-methyl-D-erythritol 4-phosphate cytidylyltransferase [Candidatus Melainabacteria bacterium GWF2_32_7]
MKITAIIPAAGSGTRYSSNKNKLFEDLSGMPVIVHTLKKISAVKEINNIIICTSYDLIGEIEQLVKNHNISKVKSVISGGKIRQESVFLGLLESRKFNPDIVLIHDGARPLISVEIIENSIYTAIEKGASVVAVPVKDTIKRVNIKTGQIIETLKRDELWNIQTPQVFKFKEILEAHEFFKGQDFTDDAALLEELKFSVSVVMGSYKNIKITTEEDLKIARVLVD